MHGRCWVAVFPSVEVLGTGLDEWGARCWLCHWLCRGSAPAGQMSCWFVVQSLDPALVAASWLVMLLVAFCFTVAVTWVVWDLFSACDDLLFCWGGSYFEWKMGILSAKSQTGNFPSLILIFERVCCGIWRFLGVAPGVVVFVSEGTKLASWKQLWEYIPWLLLSIGMGSFCIPPSCVEENRDNEHVTWFERIR